MTTKRTNRRITVFLCTLALTFTGFSIVWGEVGVHPDSQFACKTVNRGLGLSIAAIGKSASGGTSASTSNATCWGGPTVVDIHDITEDIPKLEKAIQWCIDRPGGNRVLQAPMDVLAVSLYTPGQTVGGSGGTNVTVVELEVSVDLENEDETQCVEVSSDD